MAKTIIIYSSTDGHTHKICSRLQKILEHSAHQVNVVSIKEVAALDLNTFDKIVLGASIRYGRHHAEVHDFISANQTLLDSKANAFFSVNVVARKPAKNQPHTNPYLKKFLRQIAWKPKNLAVFAGKIDYQRYRFWDRHIIRMIMWISKGPTDPKANIEFTDWTQVEAFAEMISEM